MNKNVRTLFIAASLALIAAIGACAPAPPSDPLLGEWESTDVDGSYQTLTIEGGTGDAYRAKYYDFGATVCGVDPKSGAISYAGSASGSLTKAGNVLTGTLPFYCQTTPQTLWGNVTFQFTYNPATDTITDGWGNVWTRK